MRDYEVTYILDPALGDEAVSGLTEKYAQNVKGMGGEVVDVNTWGKRRLAYELKGRQEGIYVTMRFHAGSDTAAELRRVMRLSDEVLRALFILMKAN
ncbi:MAG: 30S ribosomal protein S6 [Candidatus Xenobia bacterium]|jgi:small subunit ribosomal protein S6